jgi:hypothetical protein
MQRNFSEQRNLGKMEKRPIPQSCLRYVPNADGDMVPHSGPQAFRLGDMDQFAFGRFKPLIDVILVPGFDDSFPRGR